LEEIKHNRFILSDPTTIENEAASTLAAPRERRA
jgi:hypothetical protein